MPETTYAPTDWNVHLGIYPDPNKLPPEVPDPMAQFAGQEMSLDDYERLRRSMAVMKAQQEESRAAAIRYQGQTEFQRLLNTGMESTEALRRTAPKMFYGHPAGVSAAFSHMMPPPKQPASLTAIPVLNAKGETVSHAVQTPKGLHFLPASTETGGTGETQKEELFPGLWAVKMGGSKRWQIINQKGEGLTAYQRIELKAKAATLMKQLQDYDKGSEEYRELNGLINDIKDATEGKQPPKTDEQIRSLFGHPDGTFQPPAMPPTIAPTNAPAAEPAPAPSTGPSPFNLAVTTPPVVAAGVTNTPNSQFVPPPAAAVPPPATNAPAGVARVDPVLGNVSPELDKMLNMSAAERRMYALTNRAPAAPPTPPPPAIHTNMVPPALDNRGAVDILPLPRDKKKLIKGRMYNTKRGPALWDGENFIQE